MSLSTKPCLSQAGSAAKQLKGERCPSRRCPAASRLSRHGAALRPSPFHLATETSASCSVVLQPYCMSVLRWKSSLRTVNTAAVTLSFCGGSGQGRGQTRQAAPESCRPRPGSKWKLSRLSVEMARHRAIPGTAHRMTVTAWAMLTSHPQFSKRWLQIWLRNGLGARAPQKVSCGLLQALPQKDNKILILNLQNFHYS